MLAADETYRLVLGDCLDPIDGLAQVPDGGAQHIITDPPFSASVHAGFEISNRNDRGYERGAIGFDSMTPEWAARLSAQFARVATRWVLVFCDTESVGMWRDSLTGAGLDYVRTGTWLREGTAPQFTGDRPAAAVESIAIAHRPGRKRWSGGGRGALWKAPIVREHEGRFHPTQKPLSLLEALTRDFTDDGDLILDPFAGSATGGVAAVRLGRRWVGWERNEEWHAAATQRLAKAREQLGFTFGEAV